MPTHSAQFASPVDTGPIGLVVLWRVLWSNKIRISIPAILFAALAIFLVQRSSDTYSSEAQVLLTRGNIDIIAQEGIDRTTITSGAAVNAMTILTSRNLALDVVERLKLVDDPMINPNLVPISTEPPEPSIIDRVMFWRTPEPPERVIYSDAAIRQNAIDFLSGSADLRVLPGSNVISISVSSSDPKRSADVANAYAQAFLDRQASFTQRESQRAADALAERLGELRLQLDEDQNALQEFKGTVQTVSPAVFASLVEEANAVRKRLETVSLEAASVKDAGQRLSTASSLDLQTLRQLVDDTPKLREFETAFAQTRLAPADLAAALPGIQGVLDTELERLERVRAALAQSLETLDLRVAETNKTIVDQRQLEVEVETSSQVYETSLARFKELVVQSGLRDAGAQILMTAEEPLSADGQGRRRTVIIAFVLGLFLGIGYALIREAANERVRRVADLSDITGSNAIVQMPRRRRGLIRKPLSRNASMKSGISPFFDGIRSVRQMIAGQSGLRSDCLTIGVFSALDGEGKTTTAIALARSYVMLEKRVLLIDADMRKGDLRKNLAMGKAPKGLQQIIFEGVPAQELIKPQKDLEFDVLVSGPQIANPADLLESDTYARVFASLKRSYDVIILDTPPVLIVPEARKVASQVDAHVFVTVHDLSTKPAVQDAVAVLRDAGASDLVVTLGNAPGAQGQGYGNRSRSYYQYRARA